MELVQEPLLVTKTLGRMPSISYMNLLTRVNAFKNNRIMVIDDEEFCIASMTTMLRKADIDIQN